MPLDSLSQVLGQFEDQPHWRRQQQFRQILSCWHQVVGEAVARQAKPSHIERQVLYVIVANPMWAQTLTLERLRLLEGLNRQVSTPLKEIRFSSGAWPRQGAGQPASAQAPGPDLPEWLRQHPSYDPQAQPRATPAPAPRTVLDSYWRWATAVRQADQHQPFCPVCRCHCPAGELQRWAMCGLCAVKGWARSRV